MPPPTVAPFDVVLLEQRRGRLITTAGVAMLLTVVLAVPTAGVLLTAYSQQHADAAAALAIWSLVVTCGGLLTLMFSLQQASELDAGMRLLAPSSFDTGRLLRGPVWETEHYALIAGVLGASCSVGILISFVTRESNAAWALLVIVALTALALYASVECVMRRSSRWRSALQDLADGASALREGSAHEAAVGGTPTLRLSEDEQLLVVRVDRALPAPEYSARHVFGYGCYQEEVPAGDGWRRYRRTQPPAEHAPASGPTPPPSIAGRLGPPVAAMLAVAGALTETLSVVHGAPDTLPGWALGSAFVYASARAGIVVLGVILVANLLMALASGRLLNKISAQGGLELDAVALVAEAAGSDRATAAGLLALNRRVDNVHAEVAASVEGTVALVAAVNSRLDAVTEALAQSRAPASEQPHGPRQGERGQPVSIQERPAE